MAKKKGKGFSHRKTEPFISIPIKLVTSPIVRSLKSTSIKILLELLAQYNGHNNGNLCAPKAYMKEWGISSYTTLYNGIKELLDKELIVKTRQGLFSKGGRSCTLYAISWLPIHHCDGIELETSHINQPYRTIYQLLNNNGNKNCSN